MHFLVIVVGGDVERQLALYGERTRLTPYRRYVSEADLEVDRRVLREHPVDGLDPDDIPAVLRWGAGDAMASEGVGHDERGWYYWDTENWQARWDYWTVGGRWSHHLIIRTGGTAVRPDTWCYTGEPDPHRPECWEPAHPGKQLHAAQALKRDIDFDAMRRRAQTHADEQWDEWHADVLNGQRDPLLERYVEGFTRAQYRARNTWHPAYLVIEGRWHERGDRGLRADISDERAAQWTAFVTEQFARLPDDALITCVDCHT
ncbi:hypothetical protein [Nocardia brasiliensis]|uniref:hypothetical protein n=1 Tax=Nocardia brasiliensis TaxID=37326 RepID=UPI00245524A7|nr:hypothetical protein [Nocardia brasiliensis]